jgi:histone H3/H4
VSGEQINQSAFHRSINFFLYISDEATFLITKTTEFFIRSLAKEAFSYAAQQKKKTISKAHVEQALTMLPVEL